MTTETIGLYFHRFPVSFYSKIVHCNTVVVDFRWFKSNALVCSKCKTCNLLNSMFFVEDYFINLQFVSASQSFYVSWSYSRWQRPCWRRGMQLDKVSLPCRFNVACIEVHDPSSLSHLEVLNVPASCAHL